MRTKDDQKKEALFKATIKLVNEIGFASSSVSKIAKEANVSPSTIYVFFKNNCPFDGELYDDFRVCDMETGEMICGLAPSLGYTHAKGKCEFWKFDKDGKLMEFMFENYKTFKNAVKNGEITV